MQVHVIETASLGDRSYVITDGEVAAVIDPQRDVDRVLALLHDHGLRLTDVFETHVHNDYVTGGLALAHLTGAAYHVNAADPVAFDRHPVRDGDEVAVGAMTVTVLATPGHTLTHLSYLFAQGDEVPVVCTGGSLLYGSVGRTDLISTDLTEELTRAQHASARRLAELPDETGVLPTHGFGSFCSSGDTTGATSSTIGDEQRENQALQITDTDEFVATLVAGLDAYPRYYAHMAPANLAGPDAADLAPPALADPTELARRIHAGEWVVDLRDRVAYASDHLTGTVNIELDDAASTYLGWLIPWGTPVTLLGDGAEQVADMQRALARIGIDRPAAAAHGLPEQGAHGSYRVADFAELAKELADGGQPWVLDARRDLEWASGRLPDAHHVPLHDLPERMQETPSDATVWVHCQSGYRAAIAASLLTRAGRSVVLVDQDFDHAEEHLEVV